MAAKRTINGGKGGEHAGSYFKDKCLMLVTEPKIKKAWEKAAEGNAEKTGGRASLQGWAIPILCKAAGIDPPAVKVKAAKEPKPAKAAKTKKSPRAAAPKKAKKKEAAKVGTSEPLAAAEADVKTQGEDEEKTAAAVDAAMQDLKPKAASETEDQPMPW